MPRIARVDAYVVKMPLRVDYNISNQKSSDVDTVLVRLETADGVDGWGEAAPMAAWPRGLNPRAMVAIIEDEYAPRLKGRDPLQIGALVSELEAAVCDCPFPLACVDLALHDLAGKLLDRPVYDLLGGPVKAEIPCHYSVGIKETPEKTVTEAQRGWELGFTNFKVKVGSPNWEQEFAGLKLLREALPGAKIRIDPNRGWSHDVAIQRIRALEEHVGLALVEQPVPHYDVIGLSKICRAVDVPVMADESCFSPSDCVRLIQMEAADVFNIKLAKSGGLWNARKICAIAEAAGLTCFVGSMLELDVGKAAGLHLHAAHRVITWPTGMADLQADYLVQRPLHVTPGKGVAPLPHGPGLGVEVNMAKIEAYRVRL